MPVPDDPERLPADADPDGYPEGELEDLIEHADHPFAVESYGTTADEQLRGEPLGERLAEERSDAPADDRNLGIEDADAPDDEAEMIGESSLELDPFVPPEEAAMSIRDEAPGATDHGDDEYVELYDGSVGEE